MKYIIFMIVMAAVSSPFVRNASIIISGTVMDDAGSPLSGASVSVKGTSTGAVTDSNGFFSLTVNDNAKTLVITAVGFKTTEVTIKKNKVPLHIKLKATGNALDEVVVHAYGVQDALQGATPSVEMNSKRKRNTGPPLGNVNYSQQREFNTEDYSTIVENRFHRAVDEPLSTFSIDVDRASYSNARRFINSGQLPPAGAVRIEEFINYFHYNYPQPLNNRPFSINTELGSCPWNNHHKVVMIGLQGKKIPTENLPAANLVFLIDVSGSMEAENKLPLVKSSLKLLIEQLREQDRISMVVYAGNAGLVLPSTSGSNKTKILEAIELLEAGGSTAGGAGIKLAYKVARENFLAHGNNRVILCTDGDFNVGASSDAELVKIIEEERKSGVFLTVLGYGVGNYKDNKMQELADKGNGNHSYIDNFNEAKKVLVNEFGGTLYTIAKDVKLQVEFNPAQVNGYRLIGYENRLLNKEDFNDDTKDAGEIGSGHTVTALYEIIPAGINSKYLGKVDPLKYQKTNVTPGGDLLTVKFRYKDPRDERSKLIEHPVTNDENAMHSTNFRFATAVAEFGMLLVDSKFMENASFTSVRKLAASALDDDEDGYRAEFIQLVGVAERMKKNKNTDPSQANNQ